AGPRAGQVSALLPLLPARAARPVLRAPAELVSLHRARGPERPALARSATAGPRHRLRTPRESAGGRPPTGFGPAAPEPAARPPLAGTAGRVGAAAAAVVGLPVPDGAGAVLLDGRAERVGHRLFVP